MKHKLATTLLVVAGLVVATFSAATTTARPARAAGPFIVDGCPEDQTKKPPCANDNVILRWDEQLLSTIRAYPRQTGPTITARALGVLHTATYDAWAAYDPVAKVTRPDGPAQQQANTLDNKSKAISFAAYRVLNDLFPPGSFPSIGAYKTPDVLMTSPPPNGLGYDPNEVDNNTPGIVDTPAEVGNLAAQAVLDYRRGKLPRDSSAANPYGDGSNQVGDDPNGTSGVRYSDTTIPHYTPQNQWNSVTQQWKWQPLCVLTAPAGVNAWNADHSLPLLTPPNCVAPNYTIQGSLTPQWGKVTTFSGLGPAQFQSMAPGPPKAAGGINYSNADVATALVDTDLSGADGDLKKAKAEYWADGPGSVFPPGHTAIFAQALSRKQTNSLDTDAKLFFMVGNAEMDASIASWWQKYKYDFWRPVTAIRYLYSGQQVKSWRGPGQGFHMVDGKDWMPYQALNVVTPNFPEYVSGHSTFTAAGASLLSLFNGGDTFGAGVKIPQGSSAIEPGITPAADVTLSWPTFSDASNEAGWSRRYGGIHFYSGDMHGRAIGRQVAQYVYSKAQSYIKGSIGK
jgi:PAP2 superfamily